MAFNMASPTGFEPVLPA